MQEPSIPQFNSIRLRGVAEHIERGMFLVSLAHTLEGTAARYRLMLMAVYSCRAIVELMLEAAEMQEIGRLKGAISPRDALEALISVRLPYYNLIERIRIHDFHRFGLLPPDPFVRRMTFGGPMRLDVQGGSASVTVTPHGPNNNEVGNANVRFKRPLLVDDGKFFDEDSQQFVTLEEVVSVFLSRAPSVLAEVGGYLS